MEEKLEPKEKKKNGRPLREVDVEQLRRLGEIHCTYAEMSHILKVNESTLHARFSNIIEESRSEGKMSLRRAQFKKALEGNPALLMFLGTHVLGQTDAKEEQVRTSADEILSYIRGTLKGQEKTAFNGKKGVASKGRPRTKK